jgi:hypothetical protein
MFLYSYDAEFIQGLLKKNEKKLARSFNFTFHYIYDVLSLNNYRFGDFVDRIYPMEVEIKDTTDTYRYPYVYADCLLKNTSPKDNKYVVNQKLEHVDDISFRELIGRMRDLFLYSYDAEFIQGLLKKNEKKLARSFNFTFHYIYE